MKAKVWLNILLFAYYQSGVTSVDPVDTLSIDEFSFAQKSNLITKTEEETLRFFAVVTRHGSRSPTKTYKNDPYPYTNSKYWPDGPGGLTNLGKVQLYHTGEVLRKQLENFIDPIYQPSAGEVTYNPYDRDYMSAACLTAGLFPPVDPQIWNKTFPWQPVVQKQRDFDVCDLAFKDTCPKFKKLFNDAVDNFDKNSYKYKDLIDYVSKNAGMNYTKLSQLFDIYDTLHMQVENGFKVPQWTKSIFPFTIRPAVVNYLNEVYAANKEQLRLAAGPVLKHIAERMKMKVNGTYGVTKKFYIEAAHDCTLIVLLKALGYVKDIEIQTGAFLMFELHYVPITPRYYDYIVRVMFFPSPYDDYQPFIIGSFNNFIKFVDSIHPLDWKQACRL